MTYGDDYVRAPARPLALVAHHKSSDHPQQVHISMEGKHHMRVCWVTGHEHEHDQPAHSWVEYGRSHGKYTVTAHGNHTTYSYGSYHSGKIHHATIGPLNPGTTYYYRCGKAGDEFSLRAPPAKLPTEFVVIGDLGQTEWTKSTLSHIRDKDYGMLLLPSDLSYADGDQQRWDSFGRLVQPLASARPWMVTEGNHEKEAHQFVAYNHRWQMPYEESDSSSNLYYSFDVAGGAVHVLMLGSYAHFNKGSEQRAWLKRDLAGVDRHRTPWLVALLHAPWYNTNKVHKHDGEDMRKSMESLLYDAHVDIVFSGHVHAYERFTTIYNNNNYDSMGPVYITIGDGGNNEGLATKFTRDHKLADLSVFREASFGHGRLRILDDKTAKWKWHRNHHENASVADEVLLHSWASKKSAHHHRHA